MIHQTPIIDGELQDQIQELDDLRAKLKAETRAPGRWLGSLRRSVRARAADSSVAIEGYLVAPDEARLILAGTQPFSDKHASKAELALVCYGHGPCCCLG